MKTLTFILVVISLTGCGKQICEKDEPETVVQTIRDFSKSLQNLEFEKLAELHTANYLKYMDGRILTIEDLKNMVKGLKENSPDLKMDFSPDNFGTWVDFNSALVKYVSTARLEYPDKTTAYSFHETVYLVKEDGKWKIEHVHSSSVKNDG